MSTNAAASSQPLGVLITGASGGIGSALARLYAEPGARLCLTGRNERRLTAVSDGCRARGTHVVEKLVDVSDARAIRNIIETFDATCPLDLVIANAGISLGGRMPGESEPWSVIQRTFATNLMGVLNTVQPAIERMQRRRRGQIAIVGSLAGWRGLPSCPSYSASKAAVETYAEALRGNLVAQGIDVSIISPGYVVSGMSDRVKGPKPFLISADRAAHFIRDGLRKRRARIAFPWPMRIGAAILAGMPCWAADRVASAFAFEVMPEGDEA